MITFLDRLYRAMFCRGGYGVHSPFVFDLLTTVIEERKLYYCYDRIYPVRLQILQRADEVTFDNRTHKMNKVLKKYGFTEPEHRLLFRLANRFQPKTVLTLGSDFGLTPLYVTDFSKHSDCIVIEPEPSIASVARAYIHQYAAASVVLRSDLVEIPDGLDFVVWGAYPFDMQSFERFVPHFHEASVMVIAGINASSHKKSSWKAVCAHREVTVTIDLGRLGIVFFNPKLHRRTYKSLV